MDYFLEPDDEWDGGDGQAAEAEDHYFNNTVEGLRQSRDQYKAEAEAYERQFAATDAVLRIAVREGRIYDPVTITALERLGYLDEMVF